MYFIGGGFGGPGCPSLGQYPRAAKNPLKPPPPPKPPPFLHLAPRGGFKQDVQFPRNPPPPHPGESDIENDMSGLPLPVFVPRVPCT